MLLYKMMVNKPNKWYHECSIEMKGTREISALHKSKRHSNWGQHQGSHSGDWIWFWEETIALVFLCVGEQALVFFSQQHNGCQAQYKNRQCQECCEDGSPGAAGSGGCVHEVLEAAPYLTLGGLVKVDGYVCQEEARDEVINVQA